MVDASWYRRMFEKTDKVEIVFTPYDLLPLGSNGGAVSIKGKYNLPEDKPIIVYHELRVSIPPVISPVPPQWWLTGQWNDTEPLVAAASRLNVDSASLDDYDNTIDLSLLSWDGSPEIVRSVEGAVGGLLAGPAASVGDIFAKVMSNQGILLTDFCTDSRFTGFYPQLQGSLSEVLKQITTGLGVFLVYSPYVGASGAVLGSVLQQAPTVRLVNPEYSTRSIVEPAYVPTVSAIKYRTTKVTNSVVYKAIDVIQVTPYEDQVLHIPTDGTALVNGLVQPVPVTAITPVPYTGPASPYCVVDADDFEASGRWKALGGKIVVSAGDVPSEFVMTITAPADPDGGTYYLSEGNSIPALYVSAANGVTWVKTTYTAGTGAVLPATSYRPIAETPLLDNELVINQGLVYDRLVALSHEMSCPTTTLENISFEDATVTVGGVEVPIDPATLVNSVFRVHQAYWRFTDVSYDSVSKSWTATAIWHTTLFDHENEWGALTLDQYDAYLVSEWGTMPTIDQARVEPLRRSPNA